MANKNTRTVKIYGMSGYKYQATPTIMLKGKWLEEIGFEIGDYITVSCEDGKLIITPDTERAALAKAEQEFMETEIRVREPIITGFSLFQLECTRFWKFGAEKAALLDGAG